MEESLKTTFEEFRKFAAENREYTDEETGVKIKIIPLVGGKKFSPFKIIVQLNAMQ